MIWGTRCAHSNNIFGDGIFSKLLLHNSCNRNNTLERFVSNVTRNALKLQGKYF